MTLIIKDLFKSKTVILAFAFLLLVAYIGGINNSNLNYHSLNNKNMFISLK